MPAETHRRRDRGDLVGDVVDLFEMLLDERIGAIRADTLLADLGVDDLAALHLCDAAVEELAERGSAELDVDDILLARTVGELADIIVRSVGADDRADWSAVTDARSTDR
jgi:hypothetical protein